MNRIIVTVSILTTLAFLSCVFVSVQQHANAVVIRAIVKTWDTSPSSISGQTLLNMRNPIVSNMSFPTAYTDAFANLPIITVSSNSIQLDGILTSYTSREDTNRTSFIISLPIAETKIM